MPKNFNFVEYRNRFSGDLGLFTILLVVTALVSHLWWTLGVAALFYWPGQWLLRQAAKHDPQWLAVYTRSLSHPLIREPHGYAYTKDAKPKPIMPLASRWVI